MGLGHVRQRLAPIKREINAEGNESSKERPKNTTLANMEPVSFDFDDGNGPVALEIHIDSINDGERKEHFHVESVRDHQIGQGAQDDVGRAGADRANQHSLLAADFVHQRAVDQERKGINEGPHAENGAKFLIGHLGPQRGLGHIEGYSAPCT